MRGAGGPGSSARSRCECQLRVRRRSNNVIETYSADFRCTTLEDLVAGREDLVRVVLLLRGVQLTEGRAEVVAPLALGHGERADRVQRAAGSLAPPVGGLVGAHEPVRFVGVVGRRDADEVERDTQALLVPA